jgi:putative peptidoglycan lipid II flippase
VQDKKTNLGKVMGSSAKMAVATFSSRILGLVREQAMAAMFGASGLTDAFTVAYRIPNMLRDLFAEGAFSSAFVPIFTEARLKDPLEARRLLWSLFVLLGSITGLISIFIILFAPQLAHFLTTEKFLGDFQRFEITVTLIRIMGPFLLFVSLSALFMGALNSIKIFFVPALAPAFFNIVMIACIFFLPPLLEERGVHGIVSLGIGVLVGGFIQMLVQVPLIFKKAYGPMGPIELINDYTKRIVHRVGIGTIGIAANQINIIITTILATGTVIGAVSWLTYAFRLFQFPVGILSVSIAGSNLVHFSDAWKEGEHDRARDVLKSSYFLSYLTIVPALALLLALARESVHIVFERGAFDVEDTHMTTQALYMYLAGLPSYGLYKILAPTFFTLDRPKIPVFISVFCISMNVVFCLLTVPHFGFAALAMGTSLSMILNSGIQGAFIKKYLQLPYSFFMNWRIGKIWLSGILCFGVTKLLAFKFFLFGDGLLIKIGKFIMLGSIGALVYGGSLLLMGESQSLKKILRRS